MQTKPAAQRKRINAEFVFFLFDVIDNTLLVLITSPFETFCCGMKKIK